MDKRTLISETLYTATQVISMNNESMFNGYNHRVAHEGPWLQILHILQ